MYRVCSQLICEKLQCQYSKVHSVYHLMYFLPIMMAVIFLFNNPVFHCHCLDIVKHNHTVRAKSFEAGSAIVQLTCIVLLRRLEHLHHQY